MEKESIVNYIKTMLEAALEGAEAYASSTTNPIDDVVVKAAASILRRVFGIGKEN